MKGLHECRRLQCVAPYRTCKSRVVGNPAEAVIEYARLHGQLPVLLDDRAARRASEALGLRVYGTLSVMAMAVKGGYIESFTASVAKVKAAGLYLSDDIVETVRKTLK